MTLDDFDEDKEVFVVFDGCEHMANPPHRDMVMAVGSTGLKTLRLPSAEAPDEDNFIEIWESDGALLAACSGWSGELWESENVWRAHVADLAERRRLGRIIRCRLGADEPPSVAQLRAMLEVLGLSEHA